MTVLSCCSYFSARRGEPRAAGRQTENFPGCLLFAFNDRVKQTSMPSWWFKAPHIDCHFCGHETDLSKGKHTARSFRCANCGSLNFLKADGSLDEETHQQIYSNAHLPANQESFARRAHSTTLSQQNAFTFCQACQRNQALQTYLLASYYGDEDLPPEEEARLEALLPSYKLELEDRYPSCCSECAPAAARLLRERDNKSRAVALNNTINRGSSPVKAHRVERDPRVLLTWKLEGILWRVKGLLWVLLQLASIAMYTLGQFYRCSVSLELNVVHVGVFHSDLALRLLQQYGMRLILAVCLASFLLSFWNPLWNRLRHERMRASEPHRIKLRNLGIWNSALLFAFVLRCFFCITLRLFLFASHIRAISLVSLIPTFIVSRLRT